MYSLWQFKERATMDGVSSTENNAFQLQNQGIERIVRAAFKGDWLCKRQSIMPASIYNGSCFFGRFDYRIELKRCLIFIQPVRLKEIALERSPRGACINYRRWKNAKEAFDWFN